MWNQSSVVLLVGALLKSCQTLSLLIPKLLPWSQLKIFSDKGSNKGGVGPNSPRLAIGNQTVNTVHMYTCTHVQYTVKARARVVSAVGRVHSRKKNN